MVWRARGQGLTAGAGCWTTGTTAAGCGTGTGAARKPENDAPSRYGRKMQLQPSISPLGSGFMHLHELMDLGSSEELP